ncbi:MAG: flavin reductase family protein [Catonella sp.]|jgi:hypothetical protein|nr:flavin reductase family protein [Catonella sp.]MDY6356682.1 flavin reductase family protein [Catonella sp.]
MATHVFQPFDADVLQVNPFALSKVPAILVSGHKGGKVNAMTIGWGGTGYIWEKNVGFLFVRGSRYTKELLDAYDTFSVVFFAENKTNSMWFKYFGTASGRNEDKLKAAHMEVDFEGDTPYIDEGRTIAIMKKLSVTEIKKEDFIDKSLIDKYYTGGENENNFHYMYVGEITKLMTR